MTWQRQKTTDFVSPTTIRPRILKQQFRLRRDTIFRGGAFATVKQDLLEAFHLHTVVSQPPGTFAPYSDVKTALLFFERPGPTDEIWYYELPLPEGLKKYSKGSPIQDEHFDEVRALWAAWDTYRRGDGPRPEPTDDDKAETYRHPAEITASPLEKERQILSIVEELHEIGGDGNDNAV